MSFNPLVIVVTLIGAYLLFKLRFFFILHPARTARTMLGALKKRETRRSLMLALAGTLGVGNLFGVAVAIIVGGAGSVFWMLVSALFASVLKYAEVLLSRDSLERGGDGVKGGMFFVIRSAFGRLGGKLSFVYAAATVLVSLFMGAAIQSLTFVDTARQIFDTPPTVSAIFLAIATLVAIVGGVKIIEKITEIVIPLTTVVYILLSVSVLVVFRERIPEALGAIFSNAFEQSGIFGGVLGVLTSRAVSEGYSRGILSNEAGAGTSSAAHARGASLNPAVSGLIGILEVFFDTVILCTLTALTILVAVPDPALYGEGMPLLLSAFTSALGTGAGIPLAVCIFCFAYSTVICWYFYGSQSLSLIFKGRSTLFLPIYLSFVLLGAFVRDGILLLVTDILLLVMTVLTGLALIKNSDRILTLSELGGVVDRRVRPRFKAVRSKKSDP